MIDAFEMLADVRARLNQTNVHGINITALANEMKQELKVNWMEAIAQEQARAARDPAPVLSKRTHSLDSQLTLAWAQEFDGRDLDLDFWRRRILSAATLDYLSVGSATDQLYNSFIENGKLILRGTGQFLPHFFGKYAGNYWRLFPWQEQAVIAYASTAALTTVNPSVGKGYLEIRAKFPVADSVVPRIMLVRGTKSKQPDQKTMVPVGSITISQQTGLNNPETSQTLFTFRGPHAPDTLAGPTIAHPVVGRDQFHTYGIELLPNGTITWYLDAVVDPGTMKISGGTVLRTILPGVNYRQRRTDGNLLADGTPFDDDLFLQIELVLGGGEAGVPFPGTLNTYNAFDSVFSFPFGVLNQPASNFEIEYARYYTYKK
jgi:hypothetical protein